MIQWSELLFLSLKRNEKGMNDRKAEGQATVIIMDTEIPFLDFSGKSQRFLKYKISSIRYPFPAKPHHDFQSPQVQESVCHIHFLGLEFLFLFSLFTETCWLIYVYAKNFFSTDAHIRDDETWDILFTRWVWRHECCESQDLWINIDDV